MSTSTGIMVFTLVALTVTAVILLRLIWLTLGERQKLAAEEKTFKEALLALREETRSLRLQAEKLPPAAGSADQRNER